MHKIHKINGMYGINKKFNVYYTLMLLLINTIINKTFIIDVK